jgi:hypothetical protein
VTGDGVKVQSTKKKQLAKKTTRVAVAPAAVKQNKSKKTIPAKEVLIADSHLETVPEYDLYDSEWF